MHFKTLHNLRTYIRTKCKILNTLWALLLTCWGLCHTSRILSWSVQHWRWSAVSASVVSQFCFSKVGSCFSFIFCESSQDKLLTSVYLRSHFTSSLVTAVTAVTRNPLVSFLTVTTSRSETFFLILNSESSLSMLWWSRRHLCEQPCLFTVSMETTMNAAEWFPFVEKIVLLLFW